MKIRELYITDVNNNGDFWSQSKIDKLNDMFTQLASGLQQGIPGNAGPGGAPGGDGTLGGQGATGATGAIGLQGLSGQSIWTRTIQQNGVETLSLTSPKASVYLGGTSTLTNPLTCDDGTVISTTSNEKVPISGASKPSALRIHAINDTGGTQRHHIRLKSFIHNTATATEAFIDLNAGTETVTFDNPKITLKASNILIYDGLSAVAAFTDAGIVVSSDLTFDTGTIQVFDTTSDVILSSGLWTNHASSRLWSLLVSASAYDFIQNQTQVIYGENLYVFVDPPITYDITVSTGPTHTSGVATVDNLNFEYVGKASVAAKYKAANPGVPLTGKQLQIDTSLTEGNVKFSDLASNYVNLPEGSIVQIGKETLENYFQVNFAVQSFPSTSQGYEVTIGAGTGVWEGWYLMNGRYWRHPIGGNISGGHTLKAMTTTNNIVGAEMQPSTYSQRQLWQTGGMRTFSLSGGELDMSRNLQENVYQYNTDILYLKDGTYSGMNVWETAYVCYLNIPGLVFYMDPPPPPIQNSFTIAP